MRKILLYPFYRWGNGSSKINNWSEVTQLTRDRARISAQMCLTPNPKRVASDVTSRIAEVQSRAPTPAGRPGRWDWRPPSCSQPTSFIRLFTLQQMLLCNYCSGPGTAAVINSRGPALSMRTSRINKDLFWRQLRLRPMSVHFYLHWSSSPGTSAFARVGSWDLDHAKVQGTGPNATAVDLMLDIYPRGTSNRGVIQNLSLPPVRKCFLATPLNDSLEQYFWSHPNSSECTWCFSVTPLPWYKRAGRSWASSA